MPIWRPEEVIFPHVRADGGNMNAFFSVKGVSDWEVGAIHHWDLPLYFVLLDSPEYQYLHKLLSVCPDLKRSRFFKYDAMGFRIECLGFFFVFVVLFCWAASNTNQTMKILDWVCVMLVHFNNWSRRWEASGSLTQHLHKWPQNNGALCNGSEFLVQEWDVGIGCYGETIANSNRAGGMYMLSCRGSDMQLFRPLKLRKTICDLRKKRWFQKSVLSCVSHGSIVWCSLSIIGSACSRVAGLVKVYWVSAGTGQSRSLTHLYTHAQKHSQSEWKLQW